MSDELIETLNESLNLIDGVVVGHRGSDDAVVGIKPEGFDATAGVEIAIAHGKTADSKFMGESLRRLPPNRKGKSWRTAGRIGLRADNQCPLLPTVQLFVWRCRQR